MQTLPRTTVLGGATIVLFGSIAAAGIRNGEPRQLTNAKPSSLLSP